ncbi:hypothetical protein S40285_01918 [Stachybotrys chlorohalonatus IBT 40285]|uniref:Uncharacterized protein n=1 Tax=Stachybotrys chlorohalonatus (strain IBT 40285) TaxID=1283841 RepID=A0A084QQM3_STAC4|nr:hypothetical protein S40285_01918 [Stachybotrys chlorohalonata IBT 40285]
MASFMTDLWESIFVPGPTPSILIATNATFAALQLVLLALLVATYSVHFFVLSFLCGGLWWSINWFAAELAASQREEQAKGKDASPGASSLSAQPSGAAEDSDTEVDEQLVGSKKLKHPSRPDSGSAVASVQPTEPLGELKHRGEPPSSASTEDEWEKVSEGEKDK